MQACLPGGLCCLSDACACSSGHSLASYIFLMLHVLFIVDIFISFRVAFHENEDLITDPWATAKNYRRRVTKMTLPDWLGKRAQNRTGGHQAIHHLVVVRDGSEMCDQKAKSERFWAYSETGSSDSVWAMQDKVLLGFGSLDTLGLHCSHHHG